MALSRCLITGLIAVAPLASCGGDADDANSQITGPVVDIEAASLGEVTSFEVQSRGTRYEIFIDEDVDYGFPLGHLNEHRVTGEPVVVEVIERNGRLYAQSIEDA
jgi:hypothetical protein